MTFLFLSILSSSLINIIFKWIEKAGIKTFHCIVINYFVAAGLGFLIAGQQVELIVNQPFKWLPLAMIIGILFIIMLYLMGLSVQKAGISVTTVSTRMAVIIPILYSIFYYQENISSVKILGIILALMAVVLTVIGKQDNKIERKYIYLPLIIFFGAGIVDSMIKFAQEKYLQEDLLPLFSAILFSMSGLIGLLIFILRKQKLKELISIKTLFWGSFLGVANFGTIFFFVNALNKSTIDSSAIFGINHIGIVTLSVLAALIIFKEKISLTKWIGIAIAIFSIILLFNT